MLRACVIAKSGRHDGPLGGAAVVAHRKDAEATHATHRARLVTGVRASGRRAELVSERRPLHFAGRHSDAASAIASASRAPACSAVHVSGSRPPGRPACRTRTHVPRRGSRRTGASSTDLGHAEAVRIQSAGDGDQPRHGPRHHAVGDTERRQREQFTVRHGGQHRRGHPRAARDDVDRGARGDARRPASGRGRPSRSSSVRSAAASACSRAIACIGARCHTPTSAVAPPSSASATRSAPASTGSALRLRRGSSATPPSSTDDARAARSAASAAVAGQPRRLVRCRCALPSASRASSPAAATPGSSASGASGSDVSHGRLAAYHGAPRRSAANHAQPRDRQRRCNVG